MRRILSIRTPTLTDIHKRRPSKDSDVEADVYIHIVTVSMKEYMNPRNTYTCLQSKKGKEHAPKPIHLRHIADIT